MAMQEASSSPVMILLVHDVVAAENDAGLGVTLRVFTARYLFVAINTNISMHHMQWTNI